MGDFLRDWFVWCYLYLQHIFVMMYWVTIPGLIVCGFMSCRYRRLLQERLLKESGGTRSLLYAIGLGMTSPASRQGSIETTSTLMNMGVPPAAAMAYFAYGVRPDYGLIALNAPLKFRACGARHLSPDSLTF